MRTGAHLVKNLLGKSLKNEISVLSIFVIFTSFHSFAE